MSRITRVITQYKDSPLSPTPFTITSDYGLFNLGCCGWVLCIVLGDLFFFMVLEVCSLNVSVFRFPLELEDRPQASS